MTSRRGNGRDSTAEHKDGLVAVVAGTPTIGFAGVTIVFTEEEIAYLDERMRLACRVRPMGRVGGSSLRRHCLDGLHTH